MYYYLVWVASPAYHGESALTYASAESLQPGTLVTVPLQRRKVIGVIEAKTTKPRFTTKEILGTVGVAALPEQFSQMISWLKAYYPAPSGGLLAAALPSSLSTAPRKSITITSPRKQKEVDLPTLTKDQAGAVTQITESSERSYLLHGETGSGKTRVYLDLTERAVKAGKSVLILTPEIGLTPQLARDFEARFGEQAVVIHSMLTVARRRDIWLAILASTQPVVVIGPRSALFSPLRNIGLIVMDEAHEGAYKQEQSPYYQTSRVAARLAHLHGAKFVMGTATPSIAERYTFEQKKLPIIRMKTSAITTAEPADITVVKLDDRGQFTHSAYISETLRQQIEQALTSKEQALIYLNRRGTARIVLCQQCGWQSLCPRCDVALTYHGDTHHMRCHICGYHQSAPTTCPTCHNADITFRSIGTKSLMTDLARLFPKARIQRFDTDVAKDERLESHYEAVRRGDVDILVGTQLLSKGLDLPKLSVVGVVMADTSLQIPDFTADELTYQQLTQIIGRVGRGHRLGRVVIQTHNPDNPAIRAAVQRDYDLFYSQELKERQTFGFPPFRYLLKLECSRASSKSAETAAQKLFEELRSLRLPVEIVGPSPSFREKVADKYRWQIIIKSAQRTHLLRIIEQLPANWTHDIDPVNLL